MRSPATAYTAWSRGFRRGTPSLANTELLRLHTAPYLDSLYGNQLARILGMGLVAYLPRWLTDWRVLLPMRWAAGGTVLACRLALEQGLAVNLSGGMIAWYGEDLPFESDGGDPSID